MILQEAHDLAMKLKRCKLDQKEQALCEHRASHFF